MAVVGEAHVIVRALTNKVSDDIRKGFDGVRGDIAARTGADLGDKFTAGFNKNVGVNIFTRIADGIGSMAPSAQAARLQLNSLIKTGYKTTVAFGLIAGTIGVVIGGLGALIGAAGGAAASLTALIGTMVSLKVGSGLAGFAMKGVGEAVSSAGQASGVSAKSVKELREEMQQLRFEAEEAALAEEEFGLRLEQARENLARTADLPVNSMARREAELNFKQAELAYRQAKDRTKDLNAEVKKGVQSGAAVGGADPFAGLTESQKKFARYLITLKPIIDDLRERVASGFLPVLEKQLKRIVDSDLLGVVEKGYSGIGDALGKAVKGFTGQILKPETLEDLGGVFADIEYVVGNFGKTFGKFFRIFLKLLNASGPLIREFSDYLGDLATEFLKFLDGFTNKELEDFFTRAGDIAGKFGQIFRNIFDGLGAIISANFGPGSGGDMLLDFLIESTTGFAALGDDAEGLETYFKNVAGNLIIILDGVGGLFSGLSALGENAAIGKFFDRLKDAAPSIKNIATKGIEALPALADLIVVIADIVDKLTDSGAISTFFGIIRDFAVVIADIFKNKWVVDLLTFLGLVKAITLGLGEVKRVIDLITIGLLGNAAAASSGFGKFFSFAKTELTGLKGFAGQFGMALKSGLEPWSKYYQNVGLFERFRNSLTLMKLNFSNMTAQSGVFSKALGGITSVFGKNPWLLAIGLLIAGFITLYNTSDKFRAAVQPFFAEMAAMLTEIGLILQPVIDMFMSLWKDVIEPMLTSPGGLIDGFTQLAKNLLPLIGDLIQSIVIPAVTLLAEGLKVVIVLVQDVFNFFKLVADAFVKLFSGDVIGALKSAIGAIVIGIVGILQAVWNVIIGIINGAISLINTVIDAVDDILPENYGRIAPLPQANFTKTVAAGFGLAKGGTVMPQPGGTMALIAEAGRPERVEPLDPDGLSKRDKAMIQFLTNGTAGGGVNITVNPSAGMDETELAAVISRRLAYELRRGATA